jgi:hypothetical protein
MTSFNYYKIIDFSKYKIKENKRSLLILSMINIYDRFKIKEIQSIPIAVNFFDRYIIECENLGDLNLIVCACISIAIKSYDDIGYSNLFQILAKYFNISDHKKINNAELEVLKILDWEIHPVLTIFDIMEEWILKNPKIREIEDLDYYILASLLLFKHYDNKILAQAILSCNSDIVMTADCDSKCQKDLKLIYSNFE